MPTKYANLAGKIRPGFPRDSQNEGSKGSQWEYIGDASLISTNKPVVGETWADGLAVTSVEHTPNIENSAVSTLTVSTVYSVSGGGSTITSGAAESVRYQLVWNAIELPLIQHPEFLLGGDSDLHEDVTFSGVTTKGIWHIYFWETEPDPFVKSRRGYYPRDPDTGMRTGTEITINSGGALAYIKLREQGYSTYNVSLPTWQKVSTYTGTDAPGVDDIGEYVAGSSVPELPANLEAYEYIKTADTAERVGKSTKWQRTEAWTGYKRVYFDADTLNPALHTLP